MTHVSSIFCFLAASNNHRPSEKGDWSLVQSPFSANYGSRLSLSLGQCMHSAGQTLELGTMLTYDADEISPTETGASVFLNVVCPWPGKWPKYTGYANVWWSTITFSQISECAPCSDNPKSDHIWFIIAIPCYPYDYKPCPSGEKQPISLDPNPGCSRCLGVQRTALCGCQRLPLWWYPFEMIHTYMIQYFVIYMLIHVI